MEKAFSAVVVGAGGISGAWFPALKAEGVRVAAVVDLQKERAEEKIRTFELGAEADTDLEKTLSRHRPDFVVDLTVPEAHCSVTLTALKHGCHVIGEKPMASSMKEARRMVKAAQAAGRLYMVGQSRRWDDLNATVLRTIETGQIGPLTTVNCDFYIGAHFGGFRDEMESPLILDMAIHHFDLVRFFAKQDPVWVFAHEFNPAGSWYRGNASASCIFELTDGVIFTYRGSWCSEGCHTSWHGHWRLIGQKGTILYEQDQPPRGEKVVAPNGFMTQKAPVEVPTVTLEKRGQHGALAELMAWLRGGPVPQTVCTDNIKSLAMVFAAIESARKGRKVPVRW
jgi:predicted dehydrogenase